MWCIPFRLFSKIKQNSIYLKKITYAIAVTKKANSVKLTWLLGLPIITSSFTMIIIMESFLKWFHGFSIVNSISRHIILHQSHISKWRIGWLRGLKMWDYSILITVVDIVKFFISKPRYQKVDRFISTRY